ncbi:MAG TPA: hypothetical protein DEB17_02395 [Chlorobaculum sp.]|nr:hypothetical protein [Chlorobaculum sp.]
MKRKVLTSAGAVNLTDLFTEALERQERIAHRAPVLVMSASFTDELYEVYPCRSQLSRQFASGLLVSIACLPG